MLGRLCPKCRRIIPAGQRYCAPCQKAVDEYQERRRAEQKCRTDRAYDRQRDPKYVRFYHGAEWKTLSQAKMVSAGYQCERCREKNVTTIATEVHHLKAIRTPEGWERRFDMDNLICVCGKCHNKLHGRFGGRG